MKKCSGCSFLWPRPPMGRRWRMDPRIGAGVQVLGLPRSGTWGIGSLRRRRLSRGLECRSSCWSTRSGCIGWEGFWRSSVGSLSVTVWW